MRLDATNCKILDLLQQDGRMSLTDIARHVSLSVDAVKKRVDGMHKNGVFFSRIQLRPRQFGFPYIVDVKVSLHNYTEQDYKSMIAFLTDHVRVAELFSISGAWDLTIVIFAADIAELAAISNDIRNRYSHMIREWSESLTTVAYKFERYDMSRLLRDETPTQPQ